MSDNEYDGDAKDEGSNQEDDYGDGSLNDEFNEEDVQIENEILEAAEVREGDLEMPTQNINIKEKKEKITTRYLTKYEKARIIGTRALQISKNAPVMVNVRNDEYDPIAIAEKELIEGKLPFIIRRYLPDGSYEDWNVNNLIRIE